MALAERELVLRLPKRPGEREERWMQLLGESEAPAVAAAPAPSPGGELEERVARLEREVAELRERLGCPPPDWP
jgi:uncharacterized protein YceH (UPF0502 family)